MKEQHNQCMCVCLCVSTWTDDFLFTTGGHSGPLDDLLDGQGGGAFVVGGGELGPVLYPDQAQESLVPHVLEGNVSQRGWK